MSVFQGHILGGKQIGNEMTNIWICNSVQTMVSSSKHFSEYGIWTCGKLRWFQLNVFGH